VDRVRGVRPGSYIMTLLAQMRPELEGTDRELHLWLARAASYARLPRLSRNTAAKSYWFPLTDQTSETNQRTTPVSKPRHSRPQDHIGEGS
jgi:hypothetical protein